MSNELIGVIIGGIAVNLPYLAISIIRWAQGSYASDRDHLAAIICGVVLVILVVASLLVFEWL